MPHSGLTKGPKWKDVKSTVMYSKCWKSNGFDDDKLKDGKIFPKKSFRAERANCPKPSITSSVLCFLLNKHQKEWLPHFGHQRTYLGSDHLITFTCHIHCQSQLLSSVIDSHHCWRSRTSDCTSNGNALSYPQVLSCKRWLPHCSWWGSSPCDFEASKGQGVVALP